MHSLLNTKGLLAIEVLAVYNYYSFGMLQPGMYAENNAQRTRFGFNGMLRDDDVKDKLTTTTVDEGRGNSYSTHYRLYDPRVTRWFSIDPLVAQFPWTSPYTGMGNNPVILVDPLGSEVIATTQDAQQAIIDMLPQSTHEYVIFDDVGKIKKDIMESISSESYNYQKHQKLVKSEKVFSVEVVDKFTYKDDKGNLKMLNMNNITVIKDDRFEPGLYTPSTNEVGFTGYTLIPGSTSSYNSPDTDTKIYLNRQLSRHGKAEVNAHELLGHGYLYLKGLFPDHIILEGGYEGNEILKQEIIKSMKETKENMGITK